MGHQIVFGGCHLAERKNSDFAALWRLSPDGEELDGGGAHEVATRLSTDHPLPNDGLFWVVESSPAAVTWRSGKNGDFAALRRLLFIMS
ncbi:unnamed protein product [Spirodela intermedia]|uniref:Uncharacterized protein n=1 Tax=Spirodela intermedia TaxID=51605 RepID=A0A7I8JC47_SPIIN|nr:unnamed protein product [Spirodela intermedia]CAA6667551.1 unnamed protein product [Spirodela intermedia]